MTRNFFLAITLISLLTSCSAVKLSSNQQSASSGRQALQSEQKSAPQELRFIEDISVAPEGNTVARKPARPTNKAASASDISLYMNRASNVEKASALQFKYAVLLNTEVEQLDDTRLLEQVDEWYGTRYRMGGTTKTGIDCSAFVQSVCLSAFALSLPRTAREQYRTCQKISSTELREGDLVFFNTTGGISHVGIYLRNNKFAHASSSQGVTVSDMFDPYYLKRFIGAGRLSRPEAKSGI